MDDRFKFRAWNLIVERFQYFTLMELSNIKNIQWHVLEIMQCTGWKDNKGDLVYEGDIVKSYNDEICEIEFDEDRGCLFIASEDNDHPMCNLEFKFTIIGNIHENPELLQSGMGI